MSDAKASLAPEALQQMLGELFAPWVRELELRVLATTPGEVTLALPIAPRHVHGGGVLCGQTLMAAADTAMVLAASSAIGGFRPMTTVQLNTSFMRPIPGSQTETVGEAQVVARVLRGGKSLVFGEIEVLDASGRLAAHATTTYALL
ncbi:MAG: PaaI family thioesterase [Burkholderiaceae bacterium]|nr:PaaI family thioesterase [Burkholderiaceae bacterium]